MVACHVMVSRHEPPQFLSARSPRRQTEPWQAPVAEGGRVPRNAHGNVECPPLAPSLPIGTVHLDLRGAGQCCRQLGVDHAPALVGFERRGRGMYPVFKGIVVCTEHEAAVRQVSARWDFSVEVNFRVDAMSLHIQASAATAMGLSSHCRRSTASSTASLCDSLCDQGLAWSD